MHKKLPMLSMIDNFIHSRPHLSVAIALGAVLAPFLPVSWSIMTRLLAAWDVAVWFYLLSTGLMMLRANASKVRAMAARQDERASVVLASLSVAAFMSLAAIISQLPTLKGMPLDQRTVHYGFTVLTLLGSWFLVGFLFCFHYAHLYYQAQASGKPKPLHFPEPELEPDYWDFLYFSFTIAVAVQTSDVSVHTRSMRKLVLAQSVLNFFFNLVILGLSINIAAGLING